MTNITITSVMLGEDTLVILSPEDMAKLKAQLDNEWLSDELWEARNESDEY